MPICKPALTEKNKSANKLFNALFGLHRVGVCHGDARLANLVISKEGKYLWIDLQMHTSAFSNDQALNDLRQMLNSFHELNEDQTTKILDLYETALGNGDDKSLKSVIKAYRTHSRV